MNKNDSVLKDIKSGKGLSPLNPQSPNSSQPKGLASENRENGAFGFRLDQFTLIENDKKGSK